MNSLVRGLMALLIGSTILLGTGCGAGGPAAAQPVPGLRPAPAAQPAPGPRPAPAAQPARGPRPAPGATSGAPSGQSPLTRPDASTGLLQLGHLAPDAPAFDGYFALFGEDGTLIGSGGYGNLGPFMALPPGRYVWSMRPADAPESSPLTLTKLIEVEGGRASTVVLFNTGPQGSLQGVVTRDDLTEPAEGMGKVRVVQGASGPPLSITVGAQPARDIAYGTVTDYEEVPAGPLTVRSGASDTPLTMDVPPGALGTVLVTRTDKGVQLASINDSIARSGPPVGARRPSTVNTGSGGQAAALPTALGRPEGPAPSAAGDPSAIPPVRSLRQPTTRLSFMLPDRTTPTRLNLPLLGVDAAVRPVGVRPDGELTIPDNPHVLGWWKDGARPGDPAGTTVLAGHVDTAADGKGALFPLSRAVPGQRVVVGTNLGPRGYVITAVRSYPKAQLPARLFTATGPRRLVLITCGGRFDPRTRQYLDNVVVYAVPAG